MLNEYKLQILKLKDTLQKQSEQITSVGADEELAKAKEEAEGHQLRRPALGWPSACDWTIGGVTS